MQWLGADRWHHLISTGPTKDSQALSLSNHHMKCFYHLHRRPDSTRTLDNRPLSSLTALYQIPRIPGIKFATRYLENHRKVLFPVNRPLGHKLRLTMCLIETLPKVNKPDTPLDPTNFLAWANVMGHL